MVTLRSWYRFDKSTDEKKQLLFEAAYPGANLATGENLPPGTCIPCAQGSTHFLNIAVLTGSGKIEKVGTLNYRCEDCQPAKKKYMWYSKRFPLARAHELAAVVDSWTANRKHQNAMEEDAVKELKKSVKASLRDERARRRAEDKAQANKEKAEQKEREKKEREERKAREREEERQALLDIVKDLPKPKGKGKGKAPAKGSASASSSVLPSPSKSVSSEQAIIFEDEIESASDWSPPPLHELVKAWDQEIMDKRKGKAPANPSASTSSTAVPSPSKSSSSRKATTFREEIESASDWSPPLKARKQEMAVQTPSSPTLVASSSSSSSPSKLSQASTARSSSKIQGESSTSPKRARVVESSKKRALDDESSTSVPAKRARWALEIMDDGSFVEIPHPDSPKVPRSKRRVSASTKEDGDFMKSLHQ